MPIIAMSAARLLSFVTMNIWPSGPIAFLLFVSSHLFGMTAASAPHTFIVSGTVIVTVMVSFLTPF